jgi:hypothetical protein
MPYVSAKQRRFLKWKHPEIDAKWKAEGHDYVKKGLPRALADIPKHGEITNPYIKGRVLAHDRGKVAANLTRRAKDREQQVNAQFRRPIRARSPLTAPLSIAGDEVNRFYAMQGVRTTQGMAARAQAQGRFGREFSREKIGKGMRLSEIAKSERGDRARSAALGTGAVLAGGGFVAGGVPGAKVTANDAIVEGIKRGTPASRLTHAAQAAPGGVFGYRHAAHQRFINENLNLKDQKYTGGTPQHDKYWAGANKGRVNAEKDVMGYLKRARRVSHGALIGGAGLMAASRIKRKERKPGEVGKAERRKKEYQSPSGMAGIVGGSTLAAGSLGVATHLERKGDEWANQAARAYKRSEKMAPNAGGFDIINPRSVEPKKRTNVLHVKPHKTFEEIGAESGHTLAGQTPKSAGKLGEMHGGAAQNRYFAGQFGGNAKLVRRLGVSSGAGIAALAGYGYHQQKRDRRKRLGITKAEGLVMKSEMTGFGKDWSRDAVPFGKALHGGSNVREYSYLPENIRQDVGFGSIGIRRNPMSALDLFASSRIMAGTRGRISGRRLTRQAHREMNFAGSRAMLYSPTGRGSVY